MFPEGDLVEHGERVLVRAICGHLAFRETFGPAPDHNQLTMQRQEQAWERTPCVRCEPFYAEAILRHARELLTEKGWCRGMFAQNARRAPCHPHDERAVRFCLTGAVVRARLDLHHLALRKPVEDDPFMWVLIPRLALAVVGVCDWTDARESVDLINQWEASTRRTLDEVLQRLESARAFYLELISQVQAAAIAEHDDDAPETLVEIDRNSAYLMQPLPGFSITRT